jgi:predicted nucleic acid-binding protein
LPRLALDTNVVVYSEGLERAPTDRAKIVQSRALIETVALSGEDLVLPAQILAELHQVLVRRGGLSPAAASIAASRLGELCTIAPTTAQVLDAALEIARDHGLQIYDAIILASAADAGCDLLVSEDLHDGFVWRGVTVTNPFGPKPHPRLARLLASPAG